MLYHNNETKLYHNNGRQTCVQWKLTMALYFYLHFQDDWPEKHTVQILEESHVHHSSSQNECNQSQTRTSGFNEQQ